MQKAITPSFASWAMSAGAAAAKAAVEKIDAAERAHVESKKLWLELSSAAATGAPPVTQAIVQPMPPLGEACEVFKRDFGVVTSPSAAFLEDEIPATRAPR